MLFASHAFLVLAAFSVMEFFCVALLGCLFEGGTEEFVGVLGRRTMFCYLGRGGVDEGLWCRTIWEEEQYFVSGGRRWKMVRKKEEDGRRFLGKKEDDKNIKEKNC